MNYRIGSSLVVGIINIILGVVYFKYVLLDKHLNSYKTYIKWIPAGILFLASAILGFHSLHYKAYVHARHYIFLVCFYLFCIIGDIILSLDGCYLFGMVSFMISYIIIGLIHARYGYNKLNSVHPKKLIIGSYIIFMICMTVIVFIIKTDSREYNKFNSTISIIGILWYTKIIATTNIQMFIYFLTSPNTHWIMCWNFNMESVILCVATILFSISDCMVIYNDILYHSIYLEIAELSVYWISIYLFFLGIATHRVSKNVDNNSADIILNIDENIN